MFDPYIENIKLAVFLQIIIKTCSSLNGQLPLDKLKINQRSYYNLSNSEFEASPKILNSGIILKTFIHEDVYFNLKMMIHFLFLIGNICCGAQWKRLIETLPMSNTKYICHAENVKNRSHDNPITCADPEGGDRVSRPPPLLKNHKAIGVLSNTGLDSLKKLKATILASNVGPSSAQQRNAI